MPLHEGTTTHTRRLTFAIIPQIYCERVVATAVLTDRQEFCVIYPTLDAKQVAIADILFECERLNAEADRVLAGPARRTDLQTTKTLMWDVGGPHMGLVASRHPDAAAACDPGAALA